MRSFVIFALAVTLHGLALATVDNLRPQLFKGPGSKDHFGIFQLPDIDEKDLDPGCNDFSAICAMENATRFTDAIEAYESRLDHCGTAGWNKLGHLGAGKVATVALRTTPCGMHVAMKGSRQERLLHHIEFDCKLMEELVPVLNDPMCNGCFPRYYYHSNLTGYCYYEYIPSVPIPMFFDHVNVSSKEGFQTVKHAFVEGLGALVMLQRLHIVHQDLTFRNILVRIAPDDSRHFQVVFIDFGGSKSAKLGQAPGTKAGILGNRGRQDVYSYACSFMTYFYINESDCAVPPDGKRPTLDPTSFHDYLVGLQWDYYHNSVVPEYGNIREAFRTVSRM